MLPFSLRIIIFIAVCTSDRIENDMPMDMICIIMDGIYSLIIFPKILFDKFTYELKSRIFRNFFLFKRDDKMVSLTLIQLAEMPFCLKHLFQGILRETIISTDISAILCFIRVHDIFQAICQMLCHIS